MINAHYNTIEEEITLYDSRDDRKRTNHGDEDEYHVFKIPIHSEPDQREELGWLDLVSTDTGGGIVRKFKKHAFFTRQRISSWVQKPTVYIVGLLIAVLCWWLCYRKEQDTERTTTETRPFKNTSGEGRHTNYRRTRSVPRTNEKDVENGSS
ncbi:hypothetical protein M0802_014485 [Mischocyttarus mexicanus]|nr:hypothetical protein M0802_014485 [Mischocyttarus mexicanus]